METFTLKSILGVLVLSLAVASCLPSGDGVSAPPHEIYFPVSVRMSQSGHLLLINSNFDLKYSQGTVQSLSVERVRELTQKQCNSSSDCAEGHFCDTEPTADNAQAPSYVCLSLDDPRPCGPFGEKSVSERAIAPGRCSWVNLETPQDGKGRVIVDVAETTAFATEGLLLQRPCVENDRAVTCDDSGTDPRLTKSRTGNSYPERLFIPVRGDTTIHYLDVDKDGHFVCGRSIESKENPDFENSSEDGKELRCDKSDDASYRVYDGKTFGLDKDGNLVSTAEPPLPGDLDKEEIKEIEDDPLNDFRLQPEPIDLAASEGGRVVVVSHQEGGIVSTLMNNWIDPPALVAVLRDLPKNPLGVASIPRLNSPDQLVYETEENWDFLLDYRSDARVDLLHFDDGGLLEASIEAPSNQGSAAKSTFRPQMSRVDSTPITTNSSGIHSRGLVVDDRKRVANFEACQGDAECEAEARTTPLLVYATNRSPSSLLVGQTGGESRLAKSSLLPRFFDTIPLSPGPSRVFLGNVIGPDGELAPRVFVICFDSALIFVFDPERGVFESELRTGSGPYSLAFDYEAGVIYVAHFTDSYIGTISIDQRFPFTYGATLSTLGEPTSPRRQK